ncbi:MAG: hypothetical protein K0R17_936 [Rariglobus sp.]|nr:hypothetical protein [Rariglobus sp.]
MRAGIKPWSMVCACWAMLVISGGSVVPEAAAAPEPLEASSKEGRVLYLAPDGDDAAAGDASSPRRSLQKALDAAMPGDVIRLLPGVHAGPVVFTQGGRFGSPVTLEGVDGAILDGSTSFVPEWRPMPDVGRDVYGTPVPFEVGHVVADGQMVVLLDEDRIEEPKGGALPQWREIFRDGVQKRWEGVGGVAMYRREQKDLLVRFGDGRDPRKMQFACAPASPAGVAVTIDQADRCVVRNLELRNARVGIVIRNSLGSVVERCRVGRTRDGIVLSRGADRCTLRFNTITQHPLGVNHGVNRAMSAGQFSDPKWKVAWDLWIANKRHGFYDSRAILIDRTPGGHRVHDNHIHDHWDGISTRHWEQWKSTAAERLGWSVYNPDLEIHHNRIERMNDDALEPNDGGVNQRWHHNIVVNARCALRLKAIDKGPAYFYANQFKDNGEDIRCYGEQELNPAEIYVYHNSGTARRALNSNKVFGIGTPNYYFVNNLFWTEAWWGSLQSDAPNWKGDHNVYVRRGEGADWETQKAKAQAAGIDIHSRWVADAGSSPYADAEHGDFRLTPESPARGAGMDAAALEKFVGRALPGLEEFASAAGVDAGALRQGALPSVIPRAPEDVEVEPAGSWPAP